MNYDHEEQDSQEFQEEYKRNRLLAFDTAKNAFDAAQNAVIGPEKFIPTNAPYQMQGKL
jgi:hypothetical protein